MAIQPKDKNAEQRSSDTVIQSELMSLNMEDSLDAIMNNGDGNEQLQCDEFIVEDEVEYHGTIGSNITPIMQSLDAEGNAAFAMEMCNDDDAIIEDVDMTDEGDSDENDFMTAGNEENHGERSRTVFL